MIPYIFLTLSFLLALVSGMRSYTLLGNYIFAHTFLFMYETKFDFYFTKISSYRLFVTTFIILHLYKMISQKRWKNSLFFKSPSTLRFIAIYVLGLLVVSIMHYLWWRRWVSFLMLQYLKSSWIFFLLFDSLEEWDIKKIFSYAGFICLVILLFLTPSSLLFFYDFGNIEFSFFRIRGWIPEYLKYSGSYLLDGQLKPIVHLTETSSLIWSIFSTGFIFGAFDLWPLTFIGRGLSRFFLALSSVIILINQSAKMIFCLITQVFVSFFLRQTKEKKFQILYFLAIMSVLSIGVFWLNSNFKMKFEKEVIDISSKSNTHSRRLSMLKYSLVRTIYESPWKGFGHPDGYDEHAPLPMENVSILQATRHSEGVDKIFYFGFPIGFLASILYWLPLLLLLIYGKTLWKASRDEYCLLLVMATYGFLYRFLGELGRDVYTDVMFVYFFLVVLVFRHKKGQI